MTLFENIRTMAARRVRYVRTLREIRDMPNVLARDLGIDPTNARRIARQAVYGA